MPLPEIEQRLITDQVLKLLAASLVDVTVYDGEVGRRVDAEGDTHDEESTHPPTIPGDPQGRVAKYVVVYSFGPGTPTDTDLELSGVDLVYTVQISLTAGYRADVEDLLFQVRPLFRGFVPDVEDANAGIFQPPVGFQAGQALVDQSISPPRYRLVLQYRTTVTR